MLEPPGRGWGTRVKVHQVALEAGVAAQHGGGGGHRRMELRADELSGVPPSWLAA